MDFRAGRLAGVEADTGFARGARGASADFLGAARTVLAATFVTGRIVASGFGPDAIGVGFAAFGGALRTVFFTADFDTGGTGLAATLGAGRGILTMGAMALGTDTGAISPLPGLGKSRGAPLTLTSDATSR